MSEKKPVHLVMPHYNGKYDVIRAYLSIIERTNYPFILTIIDDGSSEDDAGYQFLKRMENNKPENVNIIFNEKNVGVTKNLNTGFNLYPELDIVRLDADIEIQSKYWLNVLVDFMEKNPNVGVSAPIGVGVDFMTVQTSGQRVVIDPEANKSLESHGVEVFENAGKSRIELPITPIEVDSCLGCCAYYRREVIDKVGGIDEEYFGWVEDNDFCVATRNEGYKCFVLPSISYCHHVHAPKRPSAERHKILQDSEKRFIDKWGFSLYDPAPYWDEIVKRYSGTEIMWRYNNESK